jgi:hypothetical protein
MCLHRTGRQSYQTTNFMKDKLLHKLSKPCGTSLTATPAVSILSMTWGLQYHDVRTKIHENPSTRSVLFEGGVRICRNALAQIRALSEMTILLPNVHTI